MIVSSPRSLESMVFDNNAYISAGFGQFRYLFGRIDTQWRSSQTVVQIQPHMSNMIGWDCDCIGAAVLNDQITIVLSIAINRYSTYGIHICGNYNHKLNTTSMSIHAHITWEYIDSYYRD